MVSIKFVVQLDNRQPIFFFLVVYGLIHTILKEDLATLEAKVLEAERKIGRVDNII